MTLVHYVSTGSVRTATHRRKKNTELLGIKVSGAQGLLLQAQAHAVCAAACTFYRMIGDPQQTPDELQCRQCESVDSSSHHAAGPFADSHELIGHIVNATASIAAAALQWSHCRISPPPADLDALVGVLVAVAQETKAMVAMLQQGCTKARLSPVIAGIRALEKHGERIFGRAIDYLQAGVSADEQALAQWREIYVAVAKAISQCGRVAEAVESLPQFIIQSVRQARVRESD